ncbi:biotin--[acetyl-CoA-carboxylase] ligase [bacterium]|nr:biotin--[acetyl-CoA-carboxylase] ligase [bacterium]
MEFREIPEYASRKFRFTALWHNSIVSKGKAADLHITQPGDLEYSLGRISALLESATPGGDYFSKFLDHLRSTPFYVTTVTSTNSVLKSRVRSGVAGEMFLVCDSQTEGRGTYNREWLDRFGKDVLFSIALDISAFPRLEIFSLLIGAAVARNIECLTGIKVNVKWPNDLVVEKRKLGGILVEIVAGKSAIIGIGINARSRIMDFPEELREHVTSIIEELPGSVEPEHLHWKGRMDRLPILVAAAGGVIEAASVRDDSSLIALIEEFKKRDKTRGTLRHIEVKGGEPVLAECKSVDLDTGELVVRMPDGEIRRIKSANDLLSPTQI